MLTTIKIERRKVQRSPKLARVAYAHSLGPYCNQLVHALILLFRNALQLRAAPLNGLQEPGQVIFEVRQNLVSVVFGAQAYLAFTSASLFHDLRTTLFGALDDFLFGGDLLGLFLSGADDTVALTPRFVKHRLALLDDPTRLLEL